MQLVEKKELMKAGKTKFLCRRLCGCRRTWRSRRSVSMMPRSGGGMRWTMKIVSMERTQNETSPLTGSV